MMVGNHINGKIGVLLRQRIQTNIRAVLSLALIVAVFTSSITSAAPAPVTNTANTLKVSPVRTDIEIAAGTTKTVPTTVSNLTKGQIAISAIENDFIAGDERGTPALILDPNQYAPTHSLKRYMKPIPNFTIPAGQAKTINVTITVPKDAQAGGYYGAIRFAPTSPDGSGQVNLSASVASLILMTVPGPTKEEVNLTDFNIQQNGKSNSYFQSSNDLEAAFRFQNKGNIQMGPLGKISVTQGDKVIYEADFNNKDQRDMILPDSARRWEIPLKNIGSFGNYTVTATFTYGSKNQTVEAKKSFWVIPQAVIFATIGGVLGLIALLLIIWFSLRSYKRRILRGNNRGYRR